VRNIVITGASRGLGRAVACEFGRRGERVAVCFHQDDEGASRTAGEIEDSGGEAKLFCADLREEGECERLMKEILAGFGSIDVLVNNAGEAADGLILNTPAEKWREALSLNLDAPFRLMKAASRAMMGKRSGMIINVSSIAALAGREGASGYAAAKAGLIGLSLAAARELGGSGVQVNVVIPGLLRTGSSSHLSEEQFERLAGENVLGRIGAPEEVAAFIAHLSTMKAVSGQIFNLDSRIRRWT